MLKEKLSKIKKSKIYNFFKNIIYKVKSNQYIYFKYLTMLYNNSIVEKLKKNEVKFFKKEWIDAKKTKKTKTKVVENNLFLNFEDKYFKNKYYRLNEFLGLSTLKTNWFFVFLFICLFIFSFQFEFAWEFFPHEFIEYLDECFKNDDVIISDYSFNQVAGVDGLATVLYKKETFKRGLIFFKYLGTKRPLEKVSRRPDWIKKYWFLRGIPFKRRALIVQGEDWWFFKERVYTRFKAMRARLLFKYWKDLEYKIVEKKIGTMFIKFTRWVDTDLDATPGRWLYEDTTSQKVSLDKLKKLRKKYLFWRYKYLLSEGKLPTYFNWRHWSTLLYKISPSFMKGDDISYYGDSRKPFYSKPKNMREAFIPEFFTYWLDESRMFVKTMYKKKPWIYKLWNFNLSRVNRGRRGYWHTFFKNFSYQYKYRPVTNYYKVRKRNSFSIVYLNFYRTTVAFQTTFFKKIWYYISMFVTYIWKIVFYPIKYRIDKFFYNLFFTKQIEKNLEIKLLKESFIIKKYFLKYINYIRKFYLSKKDYRKKYDIFAPLPNYISIKMFVAIIIKIFRLIKKIFFRLFVTDDYVALHHKNKVFRFIYIYPSHVIVVLCKTIVITILFLWFFFRLGEHKFTEMDDFDSSFYRFMTIYAHVVVFMIYIWLLHMVVTPYVPWFVY